MNNNSRDGEGYSRTGSSNRRSNSFRKNNSDRGGFRGGRSNNSGGGGYRGRGGRSFGGGRSGGRGRSGGGRRKGAQEMRPDFDLFIKKAKPVTEEVYQPEHTFHELGLHKHLLGILDRKKFTNPTPIQDQAIPHLMKGKDVIGIANTGTGKTAAFLLPLIHKTLNDPSKRVLILAPTRELAMQIEDEINTFTINTKLKSALVVGGMPMFRQIKRLRQTCHFVVGTTGRTLDLVNRRIINLETFDTIVLDEMDQMLDMGFLPDIETILEGSKEDKHLLFFSATLDKKIERVAADIIPDPVRVFVKKGQTTDNVEQNVVMHSRQDDKFAMLEEMLREQDITRAIVFDNTKRSVKDIEEKLSRMGHRVVAIHGNKTQGQRKRALTDFKKGRATIMLATNVAARGLDIPNVSHVFNFSLPQSREDYIHRIGRTGRAGKLGNAFTFVPK